MDGTVVRSCRSCGGVRAEAPRNVDVPTTAAGEGPAMNLVLVGEEAAGLQVLRLLLQDADNRIVAVLSSEPAAGDSRPGPRQFAEKHGLPLLAATAVRDPALAGELRQRGAELLLNVHSLHLVHPDVLAALPLGAFNLHPGLLPEFAGLHSASHALWLGAEQHGVTLHRMDAGIDTGPIAFQQSFAIQPDDTALSLNARGVAHGLDLVQALLAAARRGRQAIPTVPQDLSRRRYFGREVPENGCIRWSWPAQRVLALVRAADFHPFPSPWGIPRARRSGDDVGILKAARTGVPCPDVAPGTVGTATESGILAATGDEWLELRLLQVAGAPLAAGAFLRSGDHLHDGVHEPRPPPRIDPLAPLHPPAPLDPPPRIDPPPPRSDPPPPPSRR